MSESNGSNLYRDMQEKKDAKRDFFFLDQVLKARIELHLETGSHGDNDEDTNVYMAGLLESVTQAQGALAQKPYISPYDHDVRTFLDHHPGPSNEYLVYRDNADFGLVAVTVFMGFDHQGSYFARVLGDRDETGRIALYYELAASALSQIKGSRVMLVHTFYTMANRMDDIVRIMRKVASDYFDFMERMSEGSLFHLGAEVDRLANEEKYKDCLNEFLKAVSTYRSSPSEEQRKVLLRMAEKLRQLNPEFSFDPPQLPEPPEDKTPPEILPDR